MSINLEDEYPGKVDPATAEFPFGVPRNITVPDDETGTPWEEKIIKDIVGFFAALLKEDNAVPSGIPETALVSQYLNGIKASIVNEAQLTTTQLIASTKVYSEGTVLKLTGHLTSGDGASSTWIRTALTGQTPSQSPADLVDALLNDGNGVQWELVPDGKFITVFQLGATLGAGDSILAYEATFAGCKRLKATMLTAGSTTISRKFVADYSDKTSEDDEIGPNILGIGAGITEIRSTDGVATIEVKGGTGVALHQYIKIGGFKLSCTGGTGLLLDNLAFTKFEDMFFRDCNDGIVATDILTCIFDNIKIRNLVRGMTFSQADGSQPNAITLRDCHVGLNTEYGILNTGGTTFNMFGGSIEGNGTTSGSSSNWGIKSVDAGAQGEVGLNLQGVYIEGNKGTTDVWIVAGASDCVHNINNNPFNRIDVDDFTTSNIRIDQSDAGGDGVPTININGNSFTKKGTYVASSARRYIAEFADRAIINIRDNDYSDTVEIPVMMHGSGFAAVSFNGTTAAISRQKNIFSLVRGSAGDYTLTFMKGQKTPYLISGEIQSGRGFISKFSETNTTIRFQTRNTSDVLTDFTSVYINVIF